MNIPCFARFFTRKETVNVISVDDTSLCVSPFIDTEDESLIRRDDNGNRVTVEAKVVMLIENQLFTAKGYVDSGVERVVLVVSLIDAQLHERFRIDLRHLTTRINTAANRMNLWVGIEELAANTRQRHNDTLIVTIEDDRQEL